MKVFRHLVEEVVVFLDINEHKRFVNWMKSNGFPYKIKQALPASEHNQAKYVIYRELESKESSLKELEKSLDKNLSP